MNNDSKLPISELDAIKSNKSEYQLALNFIALIKSLWQQKKLRFNRMLPLGEYFSDRHEKAKMLGFGAGTTLYDSSVILGDVIVGENTWIGPFVVLDGSGSLSIGSYCSISAGVQIYTHDSIDWAISGGNAAYQYAPTIIENNCYIGPNTIIQKGVRIGSGSIIGANSFVNCDVPPHSKAFGSPIKIVKNLQQESV